MAEHKSWAEVKSQREESPERSQAYREAAAEYNELSTAITEDPETWPQVSSGEAWIGALLIFARNGRARGVLDLVPEDVRAVWPGIFK